MRLPLLAATAALIAAPALAQDFSPWSFGATASADFQVDGEAINAARSNTLTLSTLNSNLTGTGQLVLRGRDFRDTHDTGARVAVEVRYATSELAEFFGSVSYGRARAQRRISLGCIEVSGGCTRQLTGNLSDLTETSVEVGYRQWMGIGLFGDALRPYWAVRGGLTHTGGLSLIVNDATAGGIGDWALTEDTWAALIGADIGATYAISPNAEIGAELGLRYTSRLTDDDTDLGAVGLDESNNRSERLSAPVSLRLNAVF